MLVVVMIWVSLDSKLLQKLISLAFLSFRSENRACHTFLKRRTPSKCLNIAVSSNMIIFKDILEPCETAQKSKCCCELNTAGNLLTCFQTLGAPTYDFPGKPYQPHKLGAFGIIGNINHGVFTANSLWLRI